MEFRVSGLADESGAVTVRMKRDREVLRSPFLVVAVVALLPIWGMAAAEQQHHHQGRGGEKKLRFGTDGQFKILQAADMHYADGKTTPCLDVLPSQFPTCSDLNTTAFVLRMIEVEKPNLIVFTAEITPRFPPSVVMVGSNPPNNIGLNKLLQSFRKCT